ncbi:MAG: chemotaxis protein CheA [Pseudomonadota bacterium]
MSDKEDFRSSFFEECEELLEQTQDGLDALAADPQDGEAVNSVFRAVHSIKGGAGAFGLEAVVDFSHKFETAMDAIRSGDVDLTGEMLELFRMCGDNLSDLVSNARAGDNSPLAASAQLEEKLLDITGDIEEEDAPEFNPVVLDLGLDLGPDLSDDGADDDGPATYSIEFKPRADLFAAGNEPSALFKALRRLGEVNVEAKITDVPPLAELDPCDCALAWVIEITTEDSQAEIKEVFEFVEDCCDLTIEPSNDASGGLPDLGDVTLCKTDDHELGSKGGDTPALDVPGLGDLVPDVGGDGGNVQRSENADTADGRGGSGSKDMTPDASTAAPVRKPAQKNKSSSTIRVDLDRIDKLINLVGELVIKEAMLTQSVDEMDISRGSAVSTALDSLKQIASEIQEGVMAIRAQPVKPMFQRMARIVREASTATGKKVRFVTIGDYTEVDKTVIERLVDPLTHMIRNAIDHGLESPEGRAEAGKSPEGTITLSAAHRSGRVLIEVVDDGGGINRDVVRKLAIERGIIQESDQLSPGEIDHLLFMPGFSSKEEVSELSGRGVGLDVVRSAIQKLGGRVTIQSEPGEGATFSISLPLTLAVLEGMVVEVGGETMVVPISSVQETVRPAAEDLDRLGVDSVVLRNRGQLVPVIDLGAFFGFRTAPQSLEDHVLLLIAADQGPRYALVVDAIQDQRQVVIKSLETNYQQISGVAAATILGDGRIALIIDADTVMRDLGSGGPGDKPMKMAG